MGEGLWVRWKLAGKVRTICSPKTNWKLQDESGALGENDVDKSRFRINSKIFLGFKMIRMFFLLSSWSPLLVKFNLNKLLTERLRPDYSFVFNRRCANRSINSLSFLIFKRKTVKLSANIKQLKMNLFFFSRVSKVTSSSRSFLFWRSKVLLSPHATNSLRQLVTLTCKIIHGDMQWQAWCCQRAIEYLAAGCDIHLHSFHITVTMAGLHASSGWLGSTDSSQRPVRVWDTGRHCKQI